MRYLDKSSGRYVALREHPSELIALAAPGDAEALVSISGQGVLAITPSTNQDGVFLLRVRTEQESLIEIQKAAKSIRESPGVRDVVPAWIDENGLTRYSIPGLVLVRFRDPDPGAIDLLLAELGSSVARRYRTPGVVEAAVPPSTTAEALIGKLNERAGVELAEPLFYAFDDQEIRYALSLQEPDAVEAGTQDAGAPELAWNFERISLAGAAKFTDGRDDVVVFVVDNLPDAAHEAIADKLFGQIGDDLIFSADLSLSAHATNICSLIAGESGKLRGIAPGVRLAPLVVNLKSQAYAERADAISHAALLAREKKIGGRKFSRAVLSCSWRTSSDIGILRTAIEDAVESGLTLVFSAGNNGNEAPHFPSDYSGYPGRLGEGVIAICATGQNDVKAGYSNYSKAIDLAAPGGDGLPIDQGDIFCAGLDGSYELAAGTSIAVPHVAGVIALMLSVAPELSPAAIKKALQESCDPIDDLNPDYAGKIGRGRLNAAKAVAKAVKETPSSGGGGPPPPTSSGGGEEMADDALLALLLGLGFGDLFDDGQEPPEDPDEDPAAQLRSALIAVRGELEDKTGWQLVEARLEKDGQTVNVDLTSGDPSHGQHALERRASDQDSIPAGPVEGAARVPGPAKAARASRSRRKR